MKYLAFLILSFCCISALAQTPQFIAHNLSLPKELAYYDNQFSGLAINKGSLFLMSESRLQDKAEAKLYKISLADLDRKVADTAYTLPFRKCPIRNLDILREKMRAAGQSYEGLEAILIDNTNVYLTVETATPSANCYLLKGTLTDSAVVLDYNFLVTMPKPVAADNAHIYNAGFEALAKIDQHLYAFFEYNSFPAKNTVDEFDTQRLRNVSKPRLVPITKLPFRITDISVLDKNHFTAINYFFKGDGGDVIYRTPDSDLTNARLIKDKGEYKNYCRLLDIEFKNGSFSWKPVWEFPEQYNSYNWEGLAAYKGGYLIINDKYSPKKPYQTTLMYLEKIPSPGGRPAAARSRLIGRAASGGTK